MPLLKTYMDFFLVDGKVGDLLVDSLKGLPHGLPVEAIHHGFLHGVLIHQVWLLRNLLAGYLFIFEHTSMII